MEVAIRYVPFDALTTIINKLTSCNRGPKRSQIYSKYDL
jgi:hypothetical protein